jgi:putative ABC transport system permease protein
MFKATLKSLLARKLRLLLSGLAVVLGVMFVSGSFVLTDTLDRSFNNLFSTVYSGVDVQVGVKPKVAGDEGGAPDGTGGTLPAGALQNAKSVAGVKTAIGDVTGSARAIGKNGKVLTTAGAPRFGTGWQQDPSGQVVVREGQPPQHDDEVILGAYLASTGQFKVGDDISVITLQPKKTFKVSGIYGYQGNRDSLGGELGMGFTVPVAQQLMLGQTDVYSSITIVAADGVSQDELRNRVQTALGDAYQVKTGTELAKAQTDQIGEGLKFFNYILLGFAGVALFVGIFIIFNTFSIIVAQRTRELALMRAMGASRRQMISSVVLEAIVIGLIASVVGLGAGVGVGALLANFFSSFGGGSLKLAGIGVPSSAIISAFGVGIVVTVLAAIMPALRAARVAPVAAMREAATPDRPLTKPTVAGGITLAVGAGMLGYGFFGYPGDARLWMIMGGVLVCFIGVSLLTPLISRPVVSVIGKLMAWSMPGTLGRRNSARNPRRTAVTAAALMVGIALITGVSVILTSATTSITKVADTQVKADLIISGESGGGDVPASFDRATLDKVDALQGVKVAFGLSGDAALIDGKRKGVQSVTDVPAMQELFGLRATQGAFGVLTDKQLAIDEENAQERNLHSGSTVSIQLAKGEPQTYTVAVVYAKNDVFRGVVLPGSAIENFSLPQLTNAFVQVTPGTSVADVQHRVEPLFADNPEVSVQDRSAFVKQQASQFDTVLLMIQILLALAIIIAVLGVINTLALSVIERTRELGLLRAIGMRRAQVMRMITVESVVISVFGALLGLVVGTGLGVATVRALKDEGFSDLGIPWTQMGSYLLIAAVVGVVAAILPAIRAARLNVLDAISYE